MERNGVWSAGVLTVVLLVGGGCAQRTPAPIVQYKPRSIDCSVAYAEPESCRGSKRSRGNEARAAVTEADHLPSLNVTQTCKAAASNAVSSGRDLNACLGEEREAKELLANNWSKYHIDHKVQCAGMTRNGGPPSYVELVACLDIMRDASAIR